MYTGDTCLTNGDSKSFSNFKYIALAQITTASSHRKYCWFNVIDASTHIKTRLYFTET